MTEHDPLDILRRLAKHETQRISPPPTLRSEIRGREHAPPSRRRGRATRTGLIALAALALGFGGIATAGWLVSRPSTPEDAPACRSEASLDADVFVLGVGDDPIESCAELWADGVLPNPAEPLPTGQPVPPLTPCIGRGGAIEVYPAAADICEQLGLPAVTPDPGEAEESVVELESRLANEVNATGCETSDSVADRVEMLLAELGFSDWQVREQASTEATPCAKAAVDSTMLTVWIFHVPDDL